MYLVIGSGPAGVAAAKALVGRGHRVTILDVGKTLDETRRQVVGRMSRQEPEQWTPDDLETILGRRKAVDEAVHSKLSYGSAYSFGAGFDSLDIRWNGKSGFNHSLALGGLSNVWGSSLLSYRQQDMDHWPVSLDEIAPHYRAVMDFVPSTAIADRLEDILPTYSSQNNPLSPSRQGSALLDDLERGHQPLRDAGIHFGRGRLAIHSTGQNGRRPCAHCALCLSGCPYDLIYTSAHTVRELVESGMVGYLSGRIAERFESTGEGVIVSGRLDGSDERFSIRADRVFLAAGVLPTAMIALTSMNAFNRVIRLPDSQYFIYPLLRFASVTGVENERMHTSTQVFLEIDDPAVSRHLVHLQIYGYSSFLHHELNRTFLSLPLRFGPFRRNFFGRLLIAQGFLHSADSGHINLALRADPSGKTYLECSASRSAEALMTAIRVGGKLAAHSMKLRAVPLLPGLKFPNPGSGYHSGGSFPMRESPGEFQTDVLGRLPGHPRVHLVDASVLPSIAATSVTFSVMANAHRIATAASALDPP
jgi:choline dehydrogenase-like flavoprotein